MRRIVKAPSTTSYADVSISPQWHQWLRYTRPDAPSLQELQGDVLRQERLKILAREADERWAQKKSYLDPPEMQHALPATQPRDGGAYTGIEPRADGKGVKNAVVEEQGLGEGREAGMGEQVGVGVESEVARSRTSEQEVGREVRKGKGVREEKKYKEDPWKQAKGAAGEEWQPQAWNPSDMPVSRR
jgi:NADH dehydrogenase [ubiquinone] 1 alpha subcomplex assembly factor 2